MSVLSTAVIRQSNRVITDKEVGYIRDIIGKFPALSRAELTNTLCEHLEWLSPSGQPKFTACSKLLSRLEAAGVISLPPLQGSRRHFAPRRSCTITQDGEDLCQKTIEYSLSELKPIQLRLTESRQEEARWNA